MCKCDSSSPIFDNLFSEEHSFNTYATNNNESVKNINNDNFSKEYLTMEIQNNKYNIEETNDSESNDEILDEYYKETFESDSENSISHGNEKNQKKLKNLKTKVLSKRRWSDGPTIIRRNRLKRTVREIKQTYTPREQSYVTQRLLSAHKHELTDLKNKIKDLERELKEMHQENRLLKRFQARQEKEFFKIETAKGELPDILHSHNKEVSALKKHIRKEKEKNREMANNLKTKEVEIQHLKTELSKYKQLCNKKHLLKREQLQKKVENLEQEVCYRNTSIQELTRKLELTTKVHKHEIATEISHFKQTQQQLFHLQTKYDELKSVLKEKELKLQRDFIYSKRFLKHSKSDLGSHNHLEDMERFTFNNLSTSVKSAEKKDQSEESEQQSIKEMNHDTEFKVDNYDYESQSTENNRDDLELLESSTGEFSETNNKLEMEVAKTPQMKTLTKSNSAEINRNINSAKLNDRKDNSVSNETLNIIKERLDEHKEMLHEHIQTTNNETFNDRESQKFEELLRKNSSNKSLHNYLNYEEIRENDSYKSSSSTRNLSKTFIDRENQNFEELLNQRSLNKSSPRGYVKAYLNYTEKKENIIDSYEESRSNLNSSNKTSQSQNKSTLIENLFSPVTQHSPALRIKEKDLFREFSAVRKIQDELKSNSKDYQGNYSHLVDSHKHLAEYDSLSQSLNVINNPIKFTETENLFQENSKYNHSNNL